MNYVLNRLTSIGLSCFCVMAVQAMATEVPVSAQVQAVIDEAKWLGRQELWRQVGPEYGPRPAQIDQNDLDLFARWAADNSLAEPARSSKVRKAQAVYGYLVALFEQRKPIPYCLLDELKQVCDPRKL